MVYRSVKLAFKEQTGLETYKRMVVRDLVLFLPFRDFIFPVVFYIASQFLALPTL
jgi:hypothetical protein